VTYPVGPRPDAVAIGDFDADRNLDVAVVEGKNGGLVILKGDGDGSFVAQPPILVMDHPKGILAGDFNGDGELEVAVTRGTGVLLLSEADGVLFSRADQLHGLSAFSIAAGYFDGDRLQDLVVTNPDDSKVSVLINQSPPPNRPPVAHARTAARAECSHVVLDGAGSEDPDSSAGTNDDIVAYEWVVDPDGPNARQLGNSPNLTAALPVGNHRISLKVRDKCGEEDTDEVEVEVVDTTPPTSSLRLSPQTIWPPNHKLVDVTAQLEARDACGPTFSLLESVESSKEGTSADIQGADLDTADFQFAVRAERDPGAVRTYKVVYRTSDASGNVTRSIGFVQVTR